MALLEVQDCCGLPDVLATPGCMRKDPWLLSMEERPIIQLTKWQLALGMKKEDHGL